MLGLAPKQYIGGLLEQVSYRPDAIPANNVRSLKDNMYLCNLVMRKSKITKNRPTSLQIFSNYGNKMTSHYTLQYL